MKNFLKELPYFFAILLFLETFGDGYYNFFIILATYGGLVVSSCVSGFLIYKEGKTNKLFFLLLLLSFSFELIYIYNTPYYARQHDTGGLNLNGRGHLHYISWLLTKHTLPFLYQNPHLPIEHPPLYYIIGAAFIKCISLIRSSLSTDSLCEGLQYLTLFFTSATMFLFYHMIKLLKMPFFYGILAFIFMAFYPIFIFLSGSLNNDAPLLFFGTLSVLFFMRYILYDRLRILCLSAFFVALALLVKSDAIYFVLGVYLFLGLAWIKRFYSFKKTIIIGIIYACVSLPLGLSWNVYNYFKWGITPTNNSHMYRVQLERENGYNPILHTARTNDDQNISAYSYFDRLLVTIEPKRHPFIRTQQPYEYNIWNALIKSSLFDEYNLFPQNANSFIEKCGYIIALILCYLNCAFFIFFAWSFIGSKKDPVVLYLKCTAAASLIIFIAWCFLHPRWSAALARYIPDLFLCMTLVNFKYIEQLSISYPCIKRLFFVLLILYIFLFTVLVNLFFIIYFSVYR